MNPKKFKSNVAGGAIVFITILTIFLFSRVHQFADSNYSMLLTQSLLQYQSFTLDNYAIPRLQPKQQTGFISNGDIYQLELVNGHIYYFFPPGSSILSVPYVAFMNMVGISAASQDGSYSREGEAKIEASLAALLMAGLSSMIFLTGRLLLPFWWSLLIAYGSALGTQIWSTASRALWSDTWGIFILGLVIWMLVGVECKRYRLRPILLATLLSWLYFVRPTYCIPILAITAYVLLYQRKAFTKYALIGALWLAAFIGFSQYHYGQILPNYYQANRLSFDTFWLALAGNLISPSRGLLVFVPILFFVAYLLIRYRSEIALPRLIVISLSLVVVHLVVVSGFVPWYGGHSYGPRYSTGIVPWFSLLGILSVQSSLKWHDKELVNDSSALWRTEWAFGAILLLCSMILNALGATAHRTWLWNIRPVNVDEAPERVWDWKHPQFLAK
ncbi:MAG: hypothetical protein M3Y84_01300 [Acidobacteriota bacterium]|nr:hypothetical protein [Acidobacteriota bacterium]